MSDEECAQAMAYGMMAVEPGVDLLMLGEMGIANTTSAAAIYHALYGAKAEDWTGPGTGRGGCCAGEQIRVVREGAALHAADAGDGLDVLARLGREGNRGHCRGDPGGTDGAGAGHPRRLYLLRCGSVPARLGG